MISLDAKVFRRVLTAIKPAVGRDPGRPTLRRIEAFVHPATHAIYAWATDGHRLHHVTVGDTSGLHDALNVARRARAVGLDKGAQLEPAPGWDYLRVMDHDLAELESITRRAVRDGVPLELSPAIFTRVVGAAPSTLVVPKDELDTIYALDVRVRLTDRRFIAEGRSAGRPEVYPRKLIPMAKPDGEHDLTAAERAFLHEQARDRATVGLGETFHLRQATDPVWVEARYVQDAVRAGGASRVEHYGPHDCIVLTDEGGHAQRVAAQLPGPRPVSGFTFTAVVMPMSRGRPWRPT